MLRDIASEAYTAMQDTAQGAPDTQAATPNPDCLVGYVADALDHAGGISASMQSSAVRWSECCSRAASSHSMWRAARSPIASTWSSRTSSGASLDRAHEQDCVL